MKKENKYLIITIIAMIIISIISFIVMSATSAEPIQIESEDTDTISGVESIQDCPACPACNNNFREIRREDVDYRTDGKYDKWERFVLPAKGDREYWEIKIGDDTWDKEELKAIKLERVK